LVAEWQKAGGIKVVDSASTTRAPWNSISGQQLGAVENVNPVFFLSMVQPLLFILAGAGTSGLCSKDGSLIFGALATARTLRLTISTGRC